MMKTAEDALEAVKEAGAKFIRPTGAGHQMWELAGHRIVFPGRMSHMEFRGERNLIAQVKRALRDARALGPGAPPVVIPGEPVRGPRTPPGAPSDPGVAIDIATPTPPAVNIEPAPPAELAPVGPQEDPMAKLRNYACPECGKDYNGPQAVGRHRSMEHGVKGQSKSARDYHLLKARADAAKSTPAKPAPKPPKASGGALDQLRALRDLLNEVIDAFDREQADMVNALGPLMALARRKEG